jgi:hypothetical protein
LVVAFVGMIYYESYKLSFKDDIDTFDFSDWTPFDVFDELVLCLYNSIFFNFHIFGTNISKKAAQTTNLASVSPPTMVLKKPRFFLDISW